MKQHKDAAPGPSGPEKSKAELQKIIQEMKGQNFYDRLGVDRVATRDEIRKAYRSLSLEFHPDKHPADVRNLYTEIQKLLNEAYGTLSNARKRTPYDFNLENTNPAEEERRRREEEERRRKAAKEQAEKEKAAREEQERELGPKIAAAKTLAELLDILNSVGNIYTAASGFPSGSSIAIAIRSASSLAMWPTRPSRTELEQELETRQVPEELGIRRKAVELISAEWDAEEAANANPGVNPNAAPGNQTAQEKPKTPEEEAKEYVKNFIDEFNLDAILTPEFNALNEAQQMKVVQDLMRRMVDLVKSDAQTQYSEDLKGKKSLEKIRAAINKETDLKKYEVKALAALISTAEGKSLLGESLAQLVEVTKDRTIELKNGKPEVIFIPIDDTAPEAEKEAARSFNEAANNFREIPYEWGQGKKKIGTWWNPEIIKSQRGKYEDAKKKYEKAREALLASETAKIGREAALTNMLQMDNFVQMDQLTNTHPEFEAALNRLSQDSSFMDRAKDYLKMQGKDAWNAAGGKGGTNKLIFGGGMAARWLVKATAVTTGLVGLAAASGIGAAVGGVRGYFRAEQTLAEKKKEARHGKKDESKEKARMVSVTLLTNGLLKMTAQAESATDPLEKAKMLSKLAVVIEHSQSQVEKGQVDFGDAKVALANQFNFINALNKAVVLKESMSTQSDEELKKRIDALLAQAGEKISGRISEVQKAFIWKQAKNGALLGAGFAGAGYGVRWLMEHVHLTEIWSHVDKAENPNADPTLGRLHQANVKLHEARVGGAAATPDTAGALDPKADAAVLNKARTTFNDHLEKYWEAKRTYEARIKLYQNDPATLKNLKEMQAAEAKEYLDSVRAYRAVAVEHHGDDPETLSTLQSEEARINQELGVSNPDAPAADSVPRVETPAAATTEGAAAEANHATTAAFVNEGVKFEHGKGAIQGIIELKKQIAKQYGEDLSKAPESVQKFMAEPNAAKQAIELGLYDPKNAAESAVISDDAILKFDEHGNLLFGKPGHESVLENWKNAGGAMRDYDHSETMNAGADTHDAPPAATAEQGAGAPAEHAEAPHAGAPAENAPQTETQGTSSGVENATSNSRAATPDSEAWRSRPAAPSREEEVFRARSAVEEKYPPDNIRQGATVSGYQEPEPVPSTPEARVGGYREPDIYSRYPRPEARVGGYGRRYGFFGNQDYQYGRGNIIGYDPERGVYLHYFRDLDPDQMYQLDLHPEFSDNPGNLTGQNIWAAYQASRDNLNSIFRQEYSVRWNTVKNLGVDNAIKISSAGDEVQKRFGEYVLDLEKYSGLKPGSRLLGLRQESVEHYIARALKKLVGEHRLGEFQRGQ
jgi:hypothetical protein